MNSASLRQPAWFALGSLVALGWTFSELLSTDTLPAYRDLLFFVVPMKHFLGESLRQGEIPLWNPYSYMGTPFLASLQSGVFYPPSVLLIVPFPLGFNLFVLAHYLIALGGMWAWLRYRALSAPATAIGSLTFVIGGYLVSMLNVTNHLQAAPWAPWILLAWMRYCDTHTLARFLLLTLLLAVQLLAGAPEIELMTLALLAACTAYSFFPRLGLSLRLGVTLALALLFVGALTAFQVLPTLEYLGESARSGALDYREVSTLSLQPVSFLQLLLPHSSSLLPAAEANTLGHGFETVPPWIRSIYLGLVPLCLAIVGAVYGRERGLWSALILVAVLLALGKHLPLLPLLHEWLPQLFAKFRYPEKFYFIVHFSAAVLAAEGAERVLSRDGAAQRVAVVAAVTLMATGVALVALRWTRPADFMWLVDVLTGELPNAQRLVPLASDVVSKSNRLVAITATLVAIVVLARRGVVTLQTMPAALVALVAVDLAAVHHNLNLTSSWDRLNANPLPIDVSGLRQDHRRIFHYQTDSSPGEGQPARPVVGIDEWRTMGPTEGSNLEVFYQVIWAALFANRPMMLGMGAIGGFEGILRTSYGAFLDALVALPKDVAIRLLGDFSCAYLLGPVPLHSAALERVAEKELPLIFTYRIFDPLPITYLASRLRAVSSPRSAFDAMAASDFRPGSDAVVEELPPGWSDQPAGPSPSEALILIREPERVRVRVSTNHPALLILNDAFFPGWEARVDGKPAPIYRANGLARGVVVRPEDRIVEFEYHPPAWRIGTRISAAAFLVFSVLGVAAVSSSVRTRRVPSPPRFR